MTGTNSGVNQSKLQRNIFNYHQTTRVMLWGVKLYPLQHSRKRRFGPGVDAKEMDLFYLWKKNAAQFASQWGLWHEGRGSRAEKEKEKAEKLSTRKKIHFLTSLSLLSKKPPTEMPNMCCPPLPAGIFRPSGFLSSTMFCCCIPHSPTPLRKLLPCSNHLGDQRRCLWMI